MKRRLSNSLVAVLALGAASPAVGDNRWSLEKAVPQGVFLYVHSAKNPENEFLENYWRGVFEALKNSGIDRDIKNLILGAIPATEREQLEPLWQQCTDLCGAVEWGKLIDTEFVYLQTAPLPSPSHTFLFRMESETADKNVAGMKKILETIAGMAAGETGAPYRLAESEFAGARVWSFEGEGESPIFIGRRGDVVVASLQTGRVVVGGKPVSTASQAGSVFERCLKLLNGDTGVRRLSEQSNFRKVMQTLPEAENTRFFCDFALLMNGLEEGMDCVRAVLPETEAAKADPWLRAVRRGIDHFRFLDCVGSVETTDGFSTRAYNTFVFAPNAESEPLYRAFCKSPPIERFDRFVPKEATSFSVSSGVDLGEIYRTVRTFIEEDIPGGQDALVQWDDLQTQIGFNVETDLLSWVGSECISVSMAPAIPSPFGGSDSVFLMRVKDTDKARQTVERGLAALTGALHKAGQPLTTQPAARPSLEGFTTVIHPALMMFLRPVYGFSDGYLVIGTSEQAIERCLKTARGEHESIRQNPRFMQEGLIPSGPVGSVSFTDRSQLGQETAQVLGMMGMFGGFMPAHDEKAQTVRSVFSILQKLAPVAARMNFFQSEACVSRMDGQIHRSECVTHYKKPPPPVEVADEASDTRTGDVMNQEEGTPVTRK